MLNFSDLRYKLVSDTHGSKHRGVFLKDYDNISQLAICNGIFAKWRIKGSQFLAFLLGKRTATPTTICKYSRFSIIFVPSSSSLEDRETRVNGCCIYSVESNP